MLQKIKTKLNKNNKYKYQIEYRTLNLTRDILLGWYVDIKKKQLKNKNKNKIKKTMKWYCVVELMIWKCIYLSWMHFFVYWVFCVNRFIGTYSRVLNTSKLPITGVAFGGTV